MADPRFFDRAGPFTLAALAELSGARLLQPEEGGRQFSDVGPLETAGLRESAFLKTASISRRFCALAPVPSSST